MPLPLEFQVTFHGEGEGMDIVWTLSIGPQVLPTIIVNYDLKLIFFKQVLSFLYRVTIYMRLGL